MLNKTQSIVLGLVALTLVLACVDCAKTQEQLDAKAEKKREREEAQKEREEKRKALRAELAACKAKLRELLKQPQDCDTSALEKQISDLAEKVADWKAKLVQCSTDLEAKDEELDRKTQQLEECKNKPTPAPETTTPEPVTTTPQPKTTTPEPVTTTPEPKTTTPEPETTTPEPETTTKAVSAGQFQTLAGDAQFVSVSVGPAGVYAIGMLGNVWCLYYRLGTYGGASTTGTAWTMMGGMITSLDVGTDFLVAMSLHGNEIYDFDITAENKFEKVHTLDIGFTWVTVSPAGHIWAIQMGVGPVYRYGSNNTNHLGSAVANVHDGWLKAGGSLTKLSAGEFGVWGINAQGMVFYREGTMGDTEGTGTAWTQVEAPSTMKWISSGRNCVMAVNTADEVFLLSDMSSKTWRQQTSSFSNVDTYGDQVWGVKNGVVSVATLG